MTKKNTGPAIDVAAVEVADDPQLAELQQIVLIDKVNEVVKFNPIKARAAALVNEIESTVYDITTTEGEDTAKALRRRCVAMRTSADAVYKAWNRPVLDAQTEMRAIVAGIVKLVDPVETVLDEAIKAKEKIREDARLAKIATEQARIGALRAKITSIAGFPTAAAKAATANEIAVLLDTLDGCTLDEATYEEFLDEATALYGEIRTQVADMLGAAQGREAQAAQLAAQALQLEAERQAQVVATRRAAALLAIRIYPLSIMGMNSMQIEAYRSTLQEPSEQDFGDTLPEAYSVFSSSMEQIAGILSAAKATELTAVRQRIAEADAEQRRREDEAAAELRQQQATASAVLFKHQQDAFAEEQRVAQEAQRLARESIAQDRRDLEAKEAAMLAPKVVAPVAVEPVVVVQADPVTPSEPLVVTTSKVAKESQRKAASLLVAVRRTDESELDAIERLLDPEAHAALKVMRDHLIDEEELLTEIPF